MNDVIETISKDDAKDIIIGKLMRDIEITELWIRQHISGDDFSSHSALTIVADCLLDVRKDYTTTRILEKYSAMSDALFKAMACLLDYDSRKEIYDDVLKDAKDTIIKARDL